MTNADKVFHTYLNVIEGLSKKDPNLIKFLLKLYLEKKIDMRLFSIISTQDEINTIDQMLNLRPWDVNEIKGVGMLSAKKFNVTLAEIKKEIFYANK